MKHESNDAPAAPTAAPLRIKTGVCAGRAPWYARLWGMIDRGSDTSGGTVVSGVRG